MSADTIANVRKVDPTTLDIVKWNRFMPPPSSRADDEYRILRESIQQDGQKHPIEVYRGGVVDGVQRVLVCRELGIRAIVTFLPDDRMANDADIEEYMLSIQLGRRNLTDWLAMKMLARLYQLQRGKGVLASEFDRTTAKNRGITQRSARKARHQGELLNKIDDDILDAISKTCTNRDRVAEKIASLPVEVQRKVVGKNDTERTIIAAAEEEIKKQAESRADASAKGVAATESSKLEKVKPSTMTAREAMIAKISGELMQVVQLLAAFEKNEPTNRRLSDAVEFAKSSRKAFAAFCEEQNR